MRSSSVGCATLLLAPAFLVLLLFDVTMLRILSLELYSTTFPSVMGTVTSRGIETVKYTYELDGRTFQGERYRYSVNEPKDDEELGSGQVNALPPELRVGAPVRVFYRHGAPGDPVLVRGVESRTLLILLAITAPNLLLFVGVYLMVAAHLRSSMQVRFFERNGRTHVRLTDSTPALMGLAAVGVAALGAFTAVKELMGIDAPMPIVVLAWVLVVAVGVGAARWWRARLDTGLYDLILDEQARTLSLPPMHGRTARHDLKWDWIQAVVLEKQRRGGGKKTLPRDYFRCVLRTGNSPKLVYEWGEDDQDRAANLVNWLQARLGLESTAPISVSVPAPVAKKKTVAKKKKKAR